MRATPLTAARAAAVALPGLRLLSDMSVVSESLSVLARGAMVGALRVAIGAHLSDAVLDQDLQCLATVCDVVAVRPRNSAARCGCTDP